MMLTISSGSSKSTKIELSEVEKLEAELNRLKKRLKTYEGTDEKTTTEEEKKRIRTIFETFDRDKSGDLSATEFQELAFMLGETLTLDEVYERMKVIDQDDNGKISWQEFYEWWISPDHDFLKSSRKADELKLLKAKLKSKALMRTVSRINEKVELITKSEGLTDSLPTEGLAKINANLLVGNLFDAVCKLNVDVEGGAEACAPVRTELGCSSDQCALFSVAFTVKESAPDFDLGEISGSIKTVLSLVKKELRFSSYKIQLLKENGTRIFRISIIIEKEEFQALKEVDKFVQALQPKSLSAVVEVSHSPKSALDPSCNVNIRASVKGAMHRASINIINEFLHNTSSTPPEAQLNEAEPEYDEYAESSNGSQLLDKVFSLQTLSLLKTLDFDVHLDKLQQLWDYITTLKHIDKKLHKQWFKKKSEDSIPDNVWTLLHRYLKSFVAAEQLIESHDNKSDLPPGIIDIYFHALQLFDGIHSARVQFGDAAIKLAAQGFDIFAILPSRDDLETAKQTILKERAEQHADTSNSSEDEPEVFKNDEPFRKKFVYVHDGDTNGIVYYLSKLKDPPQVYASSCGKGTPDDFIARENNFCWTLNKPFSWYCVDVGENRRVIPTKYTLRYGSNGSYCCPRNWMLQGAATLQHKMDMIDNSDWKTLYVHKDDKTLNSGFGCGSWDISISESSSSEGYRYFRVVQTGANSFQIPQQGADGWSNVFVASGFEIYGELITRKPAPPSSPGNNTFNILYDNDTNGIIYYLKKTGAKIRVTASSIARGQPRDFIKRGEVFCWTQNAPLQWFMVDFGKTRRVTPNYYSFKYGSGGSSCFPRNWLFQGATELKDQTSNPDSDDWTTLSVHKNDKTFKDPHGVCSFPINDCNESFRYFRIIQTGPNSFTGGSGWKDVLVASGFELYGTLSVNKHLVESEITDSDSEDK